jgi:multiple sugar transport system permease protein
MRPGILARRRERWFYALIAPWLIGLVLFQGGPVLGALFLSFNEWALPQPPRFVGLQHFQALLSDPLFGKTLLNTLYYAAGSVPLGLALGFLLALMLNRKVRARPLFQAIFFLPVVLSGVATTLLWGQIFNGRYGLVNAFLALFGIHGPAWLQNEHWAMPALIFMSLWGVGVNMVLYQSALQGVPKELHEAAALDGAGRWSQLRHITWPLISPVTFYLIVVNTIGAFQVFTPTYLLTRGGPDNATLTLPLYIYLNAFSWGKLGYASALAFSLFSMILMLTLVQFYLAKRWVHYEI